MKLDAIKELAQQHGIKSAKMKKADLIRSIQIAEQNEPCFDAGRADSCGQDTCLWKTQCC